jgi:hypothetical protein
MTKAYLIAAVALGVFAAPQAQAQLLGGSGGLGGALGGTLSGASGPLGNLPTETLRSSTRGSARGDARTTGSQRVDRRRGSVAVDRSLEGSLDAAGAQIVDTPAGSGSAAGSGNGSAAGSGGANAQLIGTDAVRDVTGRAVGRTREVAAATRDRASGLTSNARSLSGSASGNGSASGQGNGSIGSGMLAAAGSGAAASEGAFAVTPGMPVLAPTGERFGKVRQLITDSRGRVTGVLVRAKDRDVAIPSTNLSGSGSALLMGDGAATTAREEEPTEG